MSWVLGAIKNPELTYENTEVGRKTREKNNSIPINAVLKAAAKPTS